MRSLLPNKAKSLIGRRTRSLVSNWNTDSWDPRSNASAGCQMNERNVDLKKQTVFFYCEKNWNVSNGIYLKNDILFLCPLCMYTFMGVWLCRCWQFRRPRNVNKNIRKRSKVCRVHSSIEEHCLYNKPWKFIIINLDAFSFFGEKKMLTAPLKSI